MENVILLLMFFLHFGANHFNTSTVYYRFRKVSAATNGGSLDVPGNVFKTLTTIECARTCVQNSSCIHFIREEGHTTCVTIPSQEGNDNNVLLSNQKGLYTRAGECRNDLGFDAIQLSSSVMCVQFFTDGKTYSNSKSVCDSFNGRLVKTDTREKLDSLLTYLSDKIVSTDPYYGIAVGLDDETTEGQFVWSDGQPATVEEMDLFCGGEPGGVDIENRVVIWVANKCLNDVPTYFKYGFVCEMVL